MNSCEFIPGEFASMIILRAQYFINLASLNKSKQIYEAIYIVIGQAVIGTYQPCGNWMCLCFEMS